MKQMLSSILIIYVGMVSWRLTLTTEQIIKYPLTVRFCPEARTTKLNGSLKKVFGTVNERIVLPIPFPNCYSVGTRTDARDLC